jgi:hypothetical protein
VALKVKMKTTKCPSPSSRRMIVPSEEEQFRWDGKIIGAGRPEATSEGRRDE